MRRGPNNATQQKEGMGNALMAKINALKEEEAEVQKAPKVYNFQRFQTIQNELSTDQWYNIPPVLQQSFKRVVEAVQGHNDDLVEIGQKIAEAEEGSGEQITKLERALFRRLEMIE